MDWYAEGLDPDLASNDDIHRLLDLLPEPIPTR